MESTTPQKYKYVYQKDYLACKPASEQNSWPYLKHLD
jgi:hypothetical protein